MTNIIKVQFPNHKIRTDGNEDLDQLVADLDAQHVAEETYATNHDSPMAEFLESFYYGEADVGEITENIRTEVFDAVADGDEDLAESTLEYLKSLSQVDLFGLLEPLVTLSLEGMHLITGEILSAHLGETEFEIEPVLVQRLEALDAPDLDYVKRQVDFFISDDLLGYISLDYSRFVLSITDYRDLIKAVSIHSMAKHSV